jgi:hypothetical protein
MFSLLQHLFSRKDAGLYCAKTFVTEIAYLTSVIGKNVKKMRAYKYSRFPKINRFQKKILFAQILVRSIDLRRRDFFAQMLVTGSLILRERNQWKWCTNLGQAGC